MARSHWWLSVAVVCTVAAVAAAATKTAAPAASGDEPAKRFVATLIQTGPAAIGKPEGCLASKPGAPATVGRELAAILGSFIDADRPFAIAASCEADDAGPLRQYCRLEFFHKGQGMGQGKGQGKGQEDEASLGFIFRGNPADGSLDTRTLECFQTP